MIRVVNVTEAKAQLSRLIDEAAAGHPVLIGKAGRPLVRLVAYDPSSEPRPLGAWAGRIRLSEDFDAPLPEEVLAGFDPPAADHR